MDVLKYKKIENFLSESEVELLAAYCRLRSRFPSKGNIIWDNKPSPTDQKVYGTANFKFNFGRDIIMESLLLLKQKKVEEILGEELWPTYSFWRPYFLGNSLPKHKDRPSCEVSISVCIEKDIDWPLYIDGEPVDLEPGDGVLYAGIDYEHYREKFKGDYHAQCFLHYVRKNGLYKDFKYDKRIFIGAT